MSFRDDMQRINAQVRADTQAIFLGVCVEAKNSIVFGSPLTGAPGQVVADKDGGELRASWQLSFESPTSAVISTKSNHAPQNEDGIARPGGGPYIQRAAVGGRHGVALTITNLDRIVAAETAKLGNGGNGGNGGSHG